MAKYGSDGGGGGAAGLRAPRGRRPGAQVRRARPAMADGEATASASAAPTPAAPRAGGGAGGRANGSAPALLAEPLLAPPTSHDDEERATPINSGRAGAGAAAGSAEIPRTRSGPLSPLPRWMSAVGRSLSRSFSAAKLDQLLAGVDEADSGTLERTQVVSPATAEWRWRSTVSFWIACSFIEGSLLFTVGAIASMAGPLATWKARCGGGGRCCCRVCGGRCSSVPRGRRARSSRGRTSSGRSSTPRARTSGGSR